MQGKNTLILNEETIKQALHDYFVKTVFGPGVVIEVEKITPEKENYDPNNESWKYKVGVQMWYFRKDFT